TQHAVVESELLPSVDRCALCSEPDLHASTGTGNTDIVIGVTYLESSMTSVNSTGRGLHYCFLHRQSVCIEFGLTAEQTHCGNLGSDIPNINPGLCIHLHIQTSGYKYT